MESAPGAGSVKGRPAASTGSERARADSATELQLRIRGMHCASCVITVERALSGVEGVAGASVNLVDELARVRGPAGDGDTDALVRAVEDAGYGAEGLVETGAAQEAARARDAERDAEYRDLMRRFLVGLVCGLPVVAIGHWEMIPGLPALAGEALRTAWILSGLLTLPIVLYVGGRFYTGAWHLARRGSANMDTLVALGTGAAW
ncbi:MAG: cation transporter, partial [Gemmatimonadetes bacterium]|nr:cation transporter [Gemmatimonadota bacterium]